MKYNELLLVQVLQLLIGEYIFYANKEWQEETVVLLLLEKKLLKGRGYKEAIPAFFHFVNQNFQGDGNGYYKSYTASTTGC